jgi:hypothetical protein
MKTTTTQKLLIAVVVLQGLLLAASWSGQPTAVAARGENALPDPGARQLQMVEELKGVNARLDRLTAALGSGEVVVKVKDAK